MKTFNNERVGFFTSSSIHKLMSNGRTKGSFGKPFYSYCEEKAIEMYVQRPLTNTSYSKECDWGNNLEKIAFSLLPLKYEFKAKERYKSNFFPWSGCPDFASEDEEGDIKCPFTLRSAINLHSCNTGQDIKQKATEYYWQLVSNAHLCKKKKASLVIFVPKEHRFDKIMSTFEENESPLRFKTLSEMPFIPNSSKMPEIKKITFEVPKEDIDLLIERVMEAQAERDRVLDTIKNNNNNI